ncbi:uncharacterized protein EAF02_008834 [Botrytis sinoallii]|uniref:uncharacterized protein n=1 Tax=Botrytis sinoallii TaxID=1463999 RepID=UPI001902281B|nr:uncharacterized protein EAF02_008834 [Botrytis sinoallii]KAF7872763.1 hypothetical protein EAF02_008834 [Botrytis sinoallii]
MSTRYTHEERADTLQAQLSGQASAKTKSNKAVAPSTLFTATLHAVSRRSQGRDLSSLERQLVDALEVYANPSEMIKYGEIYRENKATALSLGNTIFSASVLEMDESTPYTDEDLIRDARAALPEILANPANSIVDISSVADGYYVERKYANDDDGTTPVGGSGGGVTVFTSGPEEEKYEPKEITAENLDARAIELTSTTNLYQISMNRFKCLQAQSDSVFGSRNEIFWAIASGADSGAQKSFKTGEYGSVSTGTQVPFSGVDFFIGDIQNHLAGHIECWEADDSSSNWYDEMNKALKSMAGFASSMEYPFAPFQTRFFNQQMPTSQNPTVDAAVNAAEADDWGDATGGTGTGAAILALTALFATLLGDLTMFIKNDDDFIQKHDIAFTKAALDSIISTKPNGELSLVFDGGIQGKHEWQNGTWWAPVPTPSGNSPHGMSIADYHGNLVGVFRESGNAVKWTVLSGSTWSIPKAMNITSLSRPALATHADRLWCMYRDTSDKIQLISTGSDLNSWTTPAHISPGAVTPDGPALASYKGKLHSIVRGTTDRVYWSWSDASGGGWVGYRTFNGASITASPSLCVYQDRLQLALRGNNNELRGLR